MSTKQHNDVKSSTKGGGDEQLGIKVVEPIRRYFLSFLHIIISPSIHE